MTESLRVALVAEGTRDIGNMHDPTVDADRRTEGFLQPLIRRALGRDVQFEVLTKPLTFGSKVPKTLTSKVQKTAFQAKVQARARNCALIVFHMDADQGAPSRKKPPQKYVERRSDLDAANEHPEGVPLVPCVPIRMTEAWALGDLGAVETAAGGQLAVAVEPKWRMPETLGGEPGDRESDYPKYVLERLLGGSASPAVQAALGDSIDLAAATACCPLSLGPFIDHLRRSAP